MNIQLGAHDVAVIMIRKMGRFIKTCSEENRDVLMMQYARAHGLSEEQTEELRAILRVRMPPGCPSCGG